MKKELIRKHASILLCGFLYALKSTAAVALLVAGVLLFCCVTIESGYFAVCTFVAGLMSIAVAGMLFYNCGRDLFNGKFSK